MTNKIMAFRKPGSQMSNAIDFHQVVRMISHTPLAPQTSKAEQLVEELPLCEAIIKVIDGNDPLRIYTIEAREFTVVGLEAICALRSMPNFPK